MICTSSKLLLGGVKSKFSNDHTCSFIILITNWNINKGWSMFQYCFLVKRTADDCNTNVKVISHNPGLPFIIHVNDRKNIKFHVSSWTKGYIMSSSNSAFVFLFFLSFTWPYHFVRVSFGSPKSGKFSLC